MYSAKNVRKTHTVYVSANIIDKNNTQKDIIEKLLTYCESLPNLCSFALIADTNFLLYGKVFTRENVCCGVPIQGHYYSELVQKLAYPLIFPTCEDSDDLKSNLPHMNVTKNMQYVAFVLEN